ncbi:hypothetical protein NA56DRAFT_754481 [Hyaloscypha hepaticicola]|uniref:Uncharacterized protein n=1 Tax=Hyaloscypha hepaticicola TaxID=2082293 RepID=A0A2J6PLB9_9HELO|nr:hypothetical protein NA56DRAFT_754481 [Hyaloscypha hepaticicola]
MVETNVFTSIEDIKNWFNVAIAPLQASLSSFQLCEKSANAKLSRTTLECGTTHLQERQISSRTKALVGGRIWMIFVLGESGGDRTVGGFGGRDTGNDEENALKGGITVEERFSRLDEEERDGAQRCKGKGPVMKAVRGASRGLLEAMTCRIDNNVP